MDIVLPGKVKTIIATLESAGFEAFAVGGCVRDSLLGRTPNDWDITTSATPLQVKEHFSHTFDTGIEHGTVTVLLGKEGFEVTTYRVDGDYEDGRHPKNVTFTPDLKEDLKRRDFTINAMAYNETTGLVDLFGGKEDLQTGVIKAVGEPHERFTEDALRILRAVRFAAQLDFAIDEATSKAAEDLAGNLSRISAERIHVELEKLLVSAHPEKLRTAWELGITKVILPEFDAMMTAEQNNAHHIYSVGDHTIVAMQNIDPQPILRFTMLMHDMGKTQCARLDEKGIWHYHGHAALSVPIAAKLMKRLRFDNKTMSAVKVLVGNHSRYPKEEEADLRRNIYEIGEDLFPLWLKVKRADILAQNTAVHEEKLSYLIRIEELYRKILERGDCLSLKTLALTGSDLIADGMKGGPRMGNVLKALLEDVLEHPEHNTKEYLLEKSREINRKEED